MPILTDEEEARGVRRERAAENSRSRCHHHYHFHHGTKTKQTVAAVTTTTNYGSDVLLLQILFYNHIIATAETACYLFCFCEVCI